MKRSRKSNKILFRSWLVMLFVFTFAGGEGAQTGQKPAAWVKLNAAARTPAVKAQRVQQRLERNSVKTAQSKRTADDATTVQANVTAKKTANRETKMDTAAANTTNAASANGNAPHAIQLIKSMAWPT
ncbi:MAG: hypothetical protein ACE5GQ_10940, partial [Nitrospinales bacterium]